MPELLHCWRSTAIERKGISTCTLVFGIETVEFFLWISAIAKRTSIGDVLEMLLRDDRHRLFHETLLESDQ